MSIAAEFRTSGKKIIAIGRNYAAHIAELNNTTPTEPFFFLKPTTSYNADKEPVEVPRGVKVHHEVELGVVIGKGGRDISFASAMQHVAGYTLAIDYTGRNMQDAVKKKGLPWSAAKGMDTWCPVSRFISKDEVKDPHQLRLWYKVNGETRQDGPTSLMLYKIDRLIEHCSSIMRLEEGDLILTAAELPESGTPEGVSQVVEGDQIEAGLQQGETVLASLSHRMIRREGGYEFKSAA
ncbi:BQ5605_C008g05010 [Microbotryum silenes-dioicae]|uniref:BQ5605_C008g05010 protein n=1 Tax=Microbotryum silenes-dioicae TaxID=796604 RepID=A0A2X0MG17_9BASI|nr:BQ5605_C008g05010 [Microbotryum silenes-dioicae]